MKGLRVAGVTTLEQANAYLADYYLVWWERELTVEAANPDDAHRRLEKSHNLAASLSYVETRQVRPDYTVRWNGKLYQIDRAAVTPGLRGANVRVEQRMGGTLAVRHGDRYLSIEECVAPQKKSAPAPKTNTKTKRRTQKRSSDWNKNFDLKKGPKVWQAAQESGFRRKDAMA